MEDKEIIAKLFERSEGVLYALAERYGTICRKVSSGILNDERDVEECVNDTWLGVWNTVPPQKPDPLAAYVVRITKNLSLKKYRYNTAKKRNSIYELSYEELEDCIPNDKKESTYDSEEVVAVISKFLKDLDKKSRVMFLKRYWFFESTESIAKTMNENENCVCVKLFRIRKRLKKRFEKENIRL